MKPDTVPRHHAQKHATRHDEVDQRYQNGRDGKNLARKVDLRDQVRVRRQRRSRELQGRGEEVPGQQPAEGEAVLALKTGLKPESRDDKTLATLNYRQVGLNQQQQVVPLAQLQLDEAIDQMATGDALPQQLEAMAQVLGQALVSGMDYEDAADKLVMAYPQIDSTQLQTALARALFVADIWGQIHGQS